MVNTQLLSTRGCSLFRAVQGNCSCCQLQCGSCERIQKCCRVTSVKCIWTAFCTLNEGEEDQREGDKLSPTSVVLHVFHSRTQCSIVFTLWCFANSAALRDIHRVAKEVTTIVQILPFSSISAQRDCQCWIVGFRKRLFEILHKTKYIINCWTVSMT